MHIGPTYRKIKLGPIKRSLPVASSPSSRWGTAPAVAVLAGGDWRRAQQGGLDPLSFFLGQRLEVMALGLQWPASISWTWSGSLFTGMVGDEGKGQASRSVSTGSSDRAFFNGDGTVLARAQRSPVAVARKKTTGSRSTGSWMGSPTIWSFIVRRPWAAGWWRRSSEVVGGEEIG